MESLILVMTEGTMRAMALHSKECKIMVTDEHLAKARQLLKDEWQEMLNTAQDALEAHMGDAMYKHILNVYCNSWAVKAITS